VQVTVSVVLLVAAAVLGRGVSQAWRANLGYSTAGLYIVQWDASWKPDGRPDVSGGHGVRLAEALTREPGIRAVSQAALAPFMRALSSIHRRARPRRRGEGLPLYYVEAGCAGDHSRLRRNESMYDAIVIERTDCSSIATDLN
jgi:hypothetical protein